MSAKPVKEKEQGPGLEHSEISEIEQTITDKKSLAFWIKFYRVAILIFVLIYGAASLYGWWDDPASVATGEVIFSSILVFGGIGMSQFAGFRLDQIKRQVKELEQDLAQFKDQAKSQG